MKDSFEWFNKAFNWVKHHKKKAVFVVITLFFAPMIITHVLFKFRICDFLSAEWSAGDVLGYIGDFYAFLGTVIFSALALWQGHVIFMKNEESEKLARELEYKRDLPNFSVVCQGYSGNLSNIKIQIHNKSDNPASDIKVNELKIYDDKNKLLETSDVPNLSKFCCTKTESIYFEFANKGVKDGYFKLVFVFSYNDKFGVNHKIRASKTITSPTPKTFQFELEEIE